MNAELAPSSGSFQLPAAIENCPIRTRTRWIEAIAQLVKLGRDAVVGLVDALVDPSQGTDTQARTRAARTGERMWPAKRTTQPRREISQALASTLDGDRAKEAKGFVIRQLQVCGGKEVADALGKQLADEDLCADAAQALLAIGATGDLFRQALAQAKGKPHRLTLIQSLGVVRDSEAAAELRDAARGRRPRHPSGVAVGPGEHRAARRRGTLD